MKDENGSGYGHKPMDEEDDISFEDGFIRIVRRFRPRAQNIWRNRKRLIVLNTAVGVIVSLALVLLMKNYYISTITILPDYGEKETALSQLSSLASLAGVSVGQGTPTDVYENLLSSQAVVGPVIYAKYKTDRFSSPVDLIRYLKIKPDKNLDPALQKRDMFLRAYNEMVKGIISTTMDKSSKILTVSVRMDNGEISAEVVDSLVKSLDDYVRTKRKSYASGQLAYIKVRLEQVSDSLRTAEDRLRDFREQNRMVIQSPELMLTQERLTRNVDILGTVYLELRKQYELAKIDVIKNTPVVNVREYAEDPIMKSGPHRLTTLIIIMVLSVVMSSLYFMFKEDVGKYAGYLKGDGLPPDPLASKMAERTQRAP